MVSRLRLYGKKSNSSSVARGQTEREFRLTNVGRVFVALGSNLGDRANWLQQAREKLSASEVMSLLCVSPLYETAPVGKIEQPAFLNQVVELRTELTPAALLAQLLQIELALGRERHERWGPRNIDLDLLAFGAVQSRTASLQLPHPELHRRRFVLAPWAAIAPEFEVVGFNATVQKLLERCSDLSCVRPLNNG